jgi:hypothetical protein
MTCKAKLDDGQKICTSTKRDKLFATSGQEQQKNLLRHSKPTKEKYFLQKIISDSPPNIKITIVEMQFEILLLITDPLILLALLPLLRKRKERKNKLQKPEEINCDLHKTMTRADFRSHSRETLRLLTSYNTTSS